MSSLTSKVKDGWARWKLAHFYLRDLQDVDVSTTVPADGDTLVWVDADKKWEPGPVGGGFDPATTNSIQTFDFFNVTIPPIVIGSSEPYRVTIALNGLGISGSVSVAPLYNDGSHPTYSVNGEMLLWAEDGSTAFNQWSGGVTIYAPYGIYVATAGGITSPSGQFTFDGGADPYGIVAHNISNWTGSVGLEITRLT